MKFSHKPRKGRVIEVAGFGTVTADGRKRLWELVLDCEGVMKRGPTPYVLSCDGVATHFEIESAGRNKIKIKMNFISALFNL